MEGEICMNKMITPHLNFASACLKIHGGEVSEIRPVDVAGKSQHVYLVALDSPEYLEMFV